MLSFAFGIRFAMNSTECRHAQILAHFRQNDLTQGEEGSCCDNCHPCEIVDMTSQSRVLLQTLMELGKMGVSALCDTLAGSKSNSGEKFQDNQHFGIGQTLTKESWKHVVQELVGLGLIELSLTVSPGTDMNKTSCQLSPSPTGIQFIENVEAKVMMKQALNSRWGGACFGLGWVVS